MNPLFWILIAPLAWALALCLVALGRERDARILPSIGLLGALGTAQWFAFPWNPSGLAELAASGQFLAVLGSLGLNLLAASSAVLTAWSLRERNEAERRRWLDLEFLHELPQASLHPSNELEADLTRLLAAGCRQLECDAGIVSQVRGETWEIQAAHGSLAFEAGDRLPLRSTFCESALEQEGPVAWDSRRPPPPECPLRFERTLGLRLSGRSVGTICFGRTDQRGTPFSSADERHLVLVAQAVSSRLAADPNELSGEEVSIAVRPLPHQTPPELTRPDPGETRLGLEKSIRRLERALVASLAPGFSLSLQLDDEGAEIQLADSTFTTVLFSLLRHAEACFDDNAPGVLTLESSRIEAEGAPGKAPGFVTLSVHAPSSGAPDATRLAELFETKPPDQPELPSLSELRQLLQARDGDLSAHSARGVGVTLTLFLPVCSDDLEKNEVTRESL